MEKILFVFILLVTVTLYSAGPYYVDDAGNDLNNGTTLSTPFLTIQHAIDVVSVGLPTITSSTVYVCPGSYNENIVIASNKNLGMMVIMALSNTRPIIYGTGVPAATPGFYLNNASSVRIEHFIIKLFTDAGVGFDTTTGYSTNNYIVDNIICSNDSDGNGGDGLGIWADDCDHNYIIGNEIFGVNQDSGIYVGGGDNNVIVSNSLHDNQWDVMYLEGGSVSNYIAHNQLYSESGGIGIVLFTDGEDYNSIFSNTITGMGDKGIDVYRGDNNIIRGNVIHNCSSYGIDVRNSATYNKVVNNIIYSNSTYGIRINNDAADNNSVVSNIVYGNTSYGILVSDGDNNKIYRNLIRDNGNDGIRLANSAVGSEIINNTILRNGDDGIQWAGTSAGVVHNNIIESNNNWSVNNTSSGTIYANFNCTYNNPSGAFDAGITTGADNNTTDPYVETTKTYEIYSPLSSCIDNATNIPGVSDVYNGSGPDRGWKESPAPYTGPYYVNDDFGDDAYWGTFTLPFATLQHAADVMSAGPSTCTVSTTYVFPGNYNENVDIESNKNPGMMVIKALSNTRPIIYGTGVPADTPGFYLNNASSVRIEHFIIKLFTDAGGGFDTTTGYSTNNYIVDNIICSNDSDNNNGDGFGIWTDDCDRNYIIGNEIFGVNQDSGIYVGGGDNNFIVSNILHDNQWDVMSFDGGSVGNYIAHNQLYSESGGAGIYLFTNGEDSNSIFSNTITGMGNKGIDVYRGDNNIIRGNVIHNCTSYGIDTRNSATYNKVVNNIIYSNSSFGIRINNNLADNNSIVSNSIYGNSFGIYVNNGVNTLIQSNRIFSCNNSGIYLGGTATNTLILYNHIYSNANGIQFNLVKRNTCTSNLIYENSNDGIVFDTSTNNLFYGNRIKKNGNNGLTCESSSYSNQIIQNIITSNTANNGVLIMSSQKSECVSNILAYNAFGLSIYSGSTETKGKRNAIYHNNGHGIIIDNSTSSTLWNNSIISNGVFATYHGVIIRNSAADNELANNIIAGTKTGYGVSWDGTGSGNILKYNDYYDNNNGATNSITKGNGSLLLDPKLKWFDIYSTNFLTLRSNSSCVDKGTNLGYSYTGIAPDMGWKESVSARSKLSIIKSVSNIIAPIGNEPIPGAKIIYKLFYTNFGIGENQIMYDQLPSNVTFLTSYFASGVTGWTLQYSTNSAPTNYFNSSDYTTTIPADKTTIKWIRWKKPALSNNEIGILYYDVMIK